MFYIIIPDALSYPIAHDAIETRADGTRVLEEVFDSHEFAEPCATAQAKLAATAKLEALPIYKNLKDARTALKAATSFYHVSAILCLSESWCTHNADIADLDESGKCALVFHSDAAGGDVL